MEIRCARGYIWSVHRGDERTAMDVFADRSALDDICRKYGISRLSLFGSVLKGTQKADSDLDLLVVFDERVRPTLFDMAQIEKELSDLVGGRKIDLRTRNDLSRYFRDDVVAAAELQYAAR
jgi:predicted nucleotidyltransferase